MMKLRNYFLILIVFLGLTTSLKAQTDEKPLTRILLILDASNSMNGEWDNKIKINIARAVLSRMVDSLSQINNVQLGLRVYGHQSPVPPQDCGDTRLEVPFSDDNAAQIRIKLNYIKPKGTTPIAYSLEQCADDFPPCDNCRNVVILITDGLEACEGDPCAMSLALQRKGVILKPFVIGIGLEVEFIEAFKCIGNFYDASSAKNFSKALNDVIFQTLTQTTLQVNLNDIHGKPVESNVNMTFLDAVSGRVIDNYIHTINSAGNPDTIVVDPMYTYKIRVNTIPPIYTPEFRLKPGEHTTVSADVPQGTLKVKTNVTNNYNTLNYTVKESGKCNTLDVQYVNQEERYIVGKYDIEVNTLPRLEFMDVEIKPNQTTELDVPQVGNVVFYMKTPGYGSIYKLNEDGSQDWVCNLNPKLIQESIYLLPGKYKAVFREANRKRTINTFRVSFKSISGSTTSIKLYE